METPPPTSSGSQPARTPEEQFIEGVRGEIKQHRAYFNKQMRLYRYGRVAVIVTAAGVPVLATVTAVPRWVLGLLGAIAVAIESVQGLYQFHRSALNAMKASNDLERVLNRYMTAIGPYQGPPSVAFSVFATEIESIRAATDDAFLRVWQPTTSTPSLAERPRTVSSTDPPQVGAG